MGYNRQAAIAYAHTWAYGRNPRYADFSTMGGDCTNFLSQCLHAGGLAMNYTPVMGWYYTSLRSRAPAWSGVRELHRFLTNNTGVGPRAAEVPIGQLMPGDLVQLSFDGGATFVHGVFVVEIGSPAEPATIFGATHSEDSDYRSLSHWATAVPRFLHIF